MGFRDHSPRIACRLHAPARAPSQSRFNLRALATLRHGGGRRVMATRASRKGAGLSRDGSHDSLLPGGMAAGKCHHRPAAQDAGPIQRRPEWAARRLAGAPDSAQADERKNGEDDDDGADDIDDVVHVLHSRRERVLSANARIWPQTGGRLPERSSRTRLSRLHTHQQTPASFRPAGIPWTPPWPSRNSTTSTSRSVS